MVNHFYYKAKQFFDFANIKLNPNKCEVMTINPNKNEVGVVVSGVRKVYIYDNSFIKYSGIPLKSKRMGKVKFVESKVKRIFEEIDRLEYSGLAFNKMMQVGVGTQLRVMKRGAQLFSGQGSQV
jgi:hypothetical protein